jgi:nitric oxide reductase activation protein
MKAHVEVDVQLHTFLTQQNSITVHLMKAHVEVDLRLHTFLTQQNSIAVHPMKAHVEVDVQLHTFLTQQYMHLSDFLLPRPVCPLLQTNGGH